MKILKIKSLSFTSFYYFWCFYLQSKSLREKGDTKGSHYITIGYRSSYDTSRDMPNNDITRFRRINRITVAGRSDVAMEVRFKRLNFE